eukprot:symbB.v1.2.034991.t1/scaffold4619.1/size37387/3
MFLFLGAQETHGPRLATWPQLVSASFVLSMPTEICPEDILMEGFLVKQSKFLHEYTKHWFVLTRDHLYGFKKRGDYSQCLERILLNEPITIHAAASVHAADVLFQIQVGARMLWLCAETSELKTRWVRSFNSTELSSHMT